MHHTLGNKVLEYDVDGRGVIIDEREYDAATYNKLCYPIDPGTYHARGNNDNTIVGTFEDYKFTVTDKVSPNLGVVWNPSVKLDSIILKPGESITRPAFTMKVEGFTDEDKWDSYEEVHNKGWKGNGTFEIPEYSRTNNTDVNEVVRIGIIFNKQLFENKHYVFTILPQKCK